MQSLDLNVKASPIFLANASSRSRIVVNRGGTRSSKTFSLAQLFGVRLLSEPNKRMLIARKTRPALKLSVLHDFVSILKDWRVDHLVEYNRSDLVIRYPPTGSEVVFASVDDPQKYRGPEWNYAWLNEANEFDFEDFRQIVLRLSRKSEDGKPNQLFADFNPDDPEVWLKTELEDTGRAEVIVSNYKDNPFLSPETVAEIEYLQTTDPNFWNIYGLGEYGQKNRGLIFANWRQIDPGLWPGPGGDISEPVYGIDFGFNNPTAVVEVVRKAPRDLFARQLLYQTHLTNFDLIERLRDLVPNRFAFIYADSAEPNRIEEIRRAGFVNVHPFDKTSTAGTSGNVKTSIDYLKTFVVSVTTDSPDILAERKVYRWKEDRAGNLLDEPVKFKDHSLDAIRGAVFTHGSTYWREGLQVALPSVRKAGGRSPKTGRRRSSITDGY